MIVGLPDREARPGEMVALDLEMYGQEEHRLHIPHGEFACLSIGLGDEVYQFYDPQDVPEALRRVEKGTWVFQNALYDLCQLRRFAPIAPRYVHDTFLVERVLYGGYYTLFGLDDMARRYLQKRVDKSVRDEFSAGVEMSPEMKAYAAADAELTLEIAKIQAVERHSSYFQPYILIDQPALWAVLDMQPIKVDREMWLRLAKRNLEKGREIEQSLGVNVKSSQQVLARARELGIKLRNTQQRTLEKYADKHPFIAGVIEARMYRDAYSRYGQKWAEQYIGDGGMVWPGYLVVGTETGRMASRNPNIQQIPSRRMPEFRDAFISRRGLMMVSDVSQQEPRVLAFLSGDESLLSVFVAGEDVYQYIADEIGTDRPTAKALTLGLSYGMTPQGLARRTPLTGRQAKALVRSFFARFVGVERYITDYRKRGGMLERVETVTGRRCWLNVYGDQWENNAINSPVQGSAAEHTKRALVLLWEESRARGLPFFVCGVIHDELVVDVPEALADSYKDMVEEAWSQSAAELFPGVPFAVGTAVGASWGAK